jgi:hypothetical protein
MFPANTAAALRATSAGDGGKKGVVQMPKILRTLLLTAGLCVVAVPLAYAGNAHFIKSGTGASLSGANLVCKFKEAGLESGSIQNVTCSADTATTYACINGGGRNPSAANKRTFNTRTSRTQPFTADRNGNLVGSITLSPPTAASLGFSCPPGQTVTLMSVVYSSVVVRDQTSGAQIALPGTYTYP